jgi:hypothetical protein
MGMNDASVLAMLKRRGFSVLSHNPTGNLFFPHTKLEDRIFEDALYEMLKKYSFRIFIRDVIKNKKKFGAADLLKYSTLEWVERYIAFLLERGVISEIVHGQYTLRSETVVSFGDTLEWFVAAIFERELFSPALWGVRLGKTDAGGDYDVIAAVEGELVYVEAKSSPPKNIEELEVAAFLKRAETLSPSIAVFLEDTRLRMKDKIVPFFENAVRERGLEVKRLHDETFSIEDRVFITNSFPDIVANIGSCVERHLRARGFWS